MTAWNIAMGGRSSDACKRAALKTKKWEVTQMRSMGVTSSEDV